MKNIIFTIVATTLVFSLAFNYVFVTGRIQFEAQEQDIISLMQAK